MSEGIKDFYCQTEEHVEDKERILARWIVYYNEPVGTFMYLCDDCLADTVKANSSSFKNRMISARFLYDALNQIGGSGTLSSLSSRT